jgi:hypothetical protein
MKEKHDKTEIMKTNLGAVLWQTTPISAISQLTILTKLHVRQSFGQSIAKFHFW